MSAASSERFYRIRGYETLTVAGASVGFSAGTAATGRQGNIVAMVTVYGAPIRARFDGQAATATTGMHHEPGETFTVDGPDDLNNARFIREGAASATLEVQYGIWEGK